MEKILSSDALNDFLHTMINSSVSFVIHLAIAVVVFYVGRWIISRLYRWVHNLLNKRKADQSLTTFLHELLRLKRKLSLSGS
ncbi:MAG: hypothetical protein K2G59_03585, partial [Muribaculaceae bacterium]|nr:hypothetical protein [Muribaculaceae bacterium]